MLQERVEPKWVDTFERVFAACGVGPGEPAAILAESQSRPVLRELSELALHRLGARPFHLVVPSPPQRAPVPVRSTGASAALDRLGPVVGALAASAFVVDCTVEGLLHAPELPEILGGGARVLMVSDEHPEALERLAPDPGLRRRVEAGTARLRAARELRVTSPAGTDLVADLRGAFVAGSWGVTDGPGSIAHWPGGLCLCFPAAGTVRGRLVLVPGDVNLTFKRYLETPVVLEVEDDHVVSVDGPGLDAALFASYVAAWGDRAAYAVSHLGWGMNPAARWEALAMYDKAQTNGTELRAFAGNFLYSTGANEVAGRHTLGHFDLPMRGCTVTLDGTPVVADGELLGELAADPPG